MDHLAVGVVVVPEVLCLLLVALAICRTLHHPAGSLLAKDSHLVLEVPALVGQDTGVISPSHQAQPLQAAQKLSIRGVLPALDLRTQTQSLPLLVRALINQKLVLRRSRLLPPILMHQLNPVPNLPMPRLLLLQ